MQLLLKKSLLLLVLIGTISLSRSQTSLNYETHAPSVNTEIEYIFFDTFLLEEIQTSIGPDQEWDFSNLGAGNPTPNNVLFEYSEPEDTEGFSYYPDADIVRSGSSVSFGLYYSYDGSSYFEEGTYSPPFTAEVYTDKREIMKFPISYSDLFEETFSGSRLSLLSGDSMVIDGTTSIEADAYGSLLLPYGLIEDVLRVKVSYVRNLYIDNVTVVTLEVDDYFWYAPETKGYILQFSHNLSSNSFSQIFSLMSEESYLSVTEAQTEPQVTIFPVPTDKLLNISGVGQENMAFEIFSQGGWLVLKGKLKNNSIDTSVLGTGIYTLSIHSNKGVIRKRFAVL